MDNWELYYRTHKDKGSNAITGVPPLTFVSNGENLVDYRIYGASGGVGDRTRNLFDKNNVEIGFIFSNGDIVISEYSITTDYIFLEAGKYIMSYDESSPANNNTRYISLYNTSKVLLHGVYASYSPATGSGKVITATNDCYIRITLARGMEDSFQLEKGSIATDYEPYGYKIPIVCRGTTTNIYLDEPLEENESISMSNTGIAIPTINGTNILTVDTAVQPSNIYIKYGGGSNVNQSLMKYLEYKYKLAKG